MYFSGLLVWHSVVAASRKEPLWSGYAGGRGNGKSGRQRGRKVEI